MQISAIPSRTLHHTLIPILVIGTLVQRTFSVPHTVATRQSTLSSLQLPQCALACFLTHILDDGCVNEADFACHCADNNLLQVSGACFSRRCDTKERDDATSKFERSCQDGLGGSVGDANGIFSTSGCSKTEREQASSTTVNMIPSLSFDAIEPTKSSSSGQQSAMETRTATASRTMSKVSIRSSSTSQTTTTPIPTEASISTVSRSSQLSNGAKVGIAISIVVVVLAVALGLGLYIRRLKRQLRAAQRAAASVPQEKNHNNIFATAPAPKFRGRPHSRTWFANSTGPVSPISPYSRVMEEAMTVSSNGDGIVTKQRGEGLSVVFEREDEDSSSVRQPVPGQREGLTSPLELDGAGTGLFEMPLTITPRSRSAERS